MQFVSRNCINGLTTALEYLTIEHYKEEHVNAVDVAEPEKCD